VEDHARCADLCHLFARQQVWRAQSGQHRHHRGLCRQSGDRAETINSYEVGLKTSWLRGHLVANIDGFWTDDSNFQTTIVDVTRNNQSYFTNVGKVRSRGVEADLRGTVGDWLSLYASGTYDDAKYVSYANSPCPIEVTGQTLCNMSGRQLPGVSKWAGSIGGEAHAPLGRNFGHDTEGYLGADYSYRSSNYTTANDRSIR
jgi:iron complex outermembrane receptor protein